jgi:hypothetical protein
MNACHLTPSQPRRHSPARQHRPTQRHGAVLICVLACCFTALSLSLIAVRQALRSTRESKQILKLRQTEWLLNAGVLRVRQKLQDAHYTGETWEIPASVTGSEAAVVSVNIEPASSADNGLARTVTITVESGMSPNTLRRSCQLTVTQPTVTEPTVTQPSPLESGPALAPN